MNLTYRYFGDLQQNHLLAALPQADIDRWRSKLEPVDLAVNQVLWSVGGTPEYVYFPTSAIASLVYLTETGASAEVAVVGNDGLVGVSLLLGGGAATSEAVVQSAGRAFRLSAAFFKSELERSNTISKTMLRYAQAVLLQAAQTAICNRYHSIDQQLCRRLLLGLDRSSSNEMDMTHELVANLLGVRREGVTIAAHKLQEAGTIRYRRGHIEVLDRVRLEQQTCECYSVAKKEYRRLLPMSFAA